MQGEEGVWLCLLVSPETGFTFLLPLCTDGEFDWSPVLVSCFLSLGAAIVNGQ